MCFKVPESSSDIHQLIMSQSREYPIQEASNLMKQPLISQVRIVECLDPRTKELYSLSKSVEFYEFVSSKFL